MFSHRLAKYKSNDHQCSKCSLLLVEPIALPCGHRFCLGCLNETITSNSLNCPLCRRLFGSWPRLKDTVDAPSTSAAAASKEHQLVDEGLWGTIKKRFNDLLIKRSLEEYERSKEKNTVTDTSKRVKTNATKTRKLESNKTLATESNTLVARDTDSINIEMTHFRPICLMPLSLRNASAKIIKVPPVRLKSSQIDLDRLFKPMKSKFKQKLTSVHRRSAFSIFQPLKPIASTATSISKTTDSINRNAKGTRQRSTKLNNPLPDVTITLLNSTSKTRKRCANSEPKATVTIENKNTRTNRLRSERQNKHENGISNKNGVKLLPLIVNKIKTDSPLSKKRRCQQEREDFQLAKMLQEYDDNAHSPSTNRTVRYSLRSRNKSSASSLSTSSSSLESFNNKLCSIVNKSRKSGKPTPSNILASTAKADVRNGQNINNNNNNNNDISGSSVKNKIIDRKPIFNCQKFTRSRRLLLTVSE